MLASILFLLSVFSIHAQKMTSIIKRDIKGNITQNFANHGIEFFITSKKSRYNEGENIPIFIKVKNIGNYPITLYMHKNYLHNFTIIVRDEQGRNLPIKETVYKSKKELTKDPFFKNYTGTSPHHRAIILQPEETFEKKIILQDIINIIKRKTDTEKFQIQGYFYPNPEQASTVFLKSINHYVIFIDTDRTSTDNQGVNPYKPYRLVITPKEIVYLTLSAEYARNWLDFFKYLSLHDLIKDYPKYARKYIKASAKQRRVILGDFQAYLQNNHTRKLIHFNIITSKKNKHWRKKLDQSAMVQSEIIRNIDGFRRKLLYTYYLTRMENLWKITGIESQLIE